MRTKRKIVSSNDEKGFGFIAPSSGGKEMSVHISSFKDHNQRSEINQFVTYASSSDRQGRPCATKALLAGDTPDKTKRNNDSVLIVVAAFFLIIVGVSALTGRVPALILALYLVASLLTFIIYAIDKSAAKRGAWRTPESNLHLLSLALGVGRVLSSLNISYAINLRNSHSGQFSR